MASLSSDKKDNRKIQYVNRQGRRQTLYLGKMPLKTAQGFKFKVEHLIGAAATGTAIPADIASWLANDISDVLHARLVNLQLAPPRKKQEQAALETFTESYIVSRTDARPNSIRNLRQVQTRMVKFFGKDRQLHTITPGDADEWLLKLKEKYADATAGRTIKYARQFFRAAIRKGLVKENPFAEVKPPKATNRSRIFFIDQATAEKVLDACPSAEWRLIFALSRFGGLRCPSEHLALTLDDADWDKNTLRIRSPKKEHHEGDGERLIPLFPELRPHLEAVYDAAPPGTVYFITSTRDPGVNWRQQLLRIVRKAGLQPWEKLFHNLRSSRQNELMEQFPIHVVCQWLGNSPAVAAGHYLAARPEDYARAAGSVLHDTTHDGAGWDRMEEVGASKETENPGTLAFSSDSGAERYARQESNEAAESLENTLPILYRVAGSNATAKTDPDLQLVLDHWPHLSIATRKAILALVQKQSRRAA